jgi:transcriptional regulator with XRE-family HTH domain
MSLTTENRHGASFRHMTKEPVQIHKGRQPRRPHYIAEWAERRHMSQADLARELGADKSVISRWFAGSTPGTEWQQRLADLFEIEPESLFRSPDDDWLARFFAGRQRDEIERIKQMLEVAFPTKKKNSA